MKPEPSRPAPLLGRVLRFAQKELRETLRDRRTLVTLVLMPVLLYPLLALAFQQFLAASKPAAVEVLRVGVVSEAEGQEIRGILENGREALAAEGRTRPPGERTRPLDYRLSDDLRSDLIGGRIDLGVQRRQAAPAGRDRLAPPMEFELLTLDGSLSGEEARAAVQARLDAANRLYLQARLSQAAGRPQPALASAHLTVVADPQRKESSLLATLVPLILILMTITGAVYPAIDLTAGERERGTLEVLMAAPVPRVGLLAAKYLAVLTVALLTALVNLTMMTATLLAIPGLGPLVLGKAGLTAGLVLGTLGLLLLFALFFSAVLLAVTSFARSFKEAQAYLIPLMLASITPGLLALMPGLRLEGPLAVTPLVNVALLGRDLFEGAVHPVAVAVVVGSTLLYAAAALALAARIFGAEAVLYSDQTGWHDLFRRPAAASDHPSLGGALFCLAVLFPAVFLLNGTVVQQEELGDETKLALLALGSAALFAGLPLLAAALGRVRLKPAFALGAPPWLGAAAALLLGASLWPFAAQFALWLKQFGVGQQTAGMTERLRPLLESWHGQAVLIAYLAVVAPLVEELFFRGYLFGALRTVWRPGATVVGSGVLFGLFHLVATDGLAWERLPITTALGLLLGWVRLRTGSVWPGVLLHMAHNGVLTTAFIHPGWFGMDGEAVPWPWLLAGAAGVGVGASLLGLAVQPRDAGG